MRLYFVIILSAFISFYGESRPQNVTTATKIINVEDVLHSKLGIKKGILKTDKCYSSCNPNRGFCPITGTCNFIYEIRDVFITELVNIDVQKPDLKSIPSKGVYDNKLIKNCTSSNYPYKRKLKYEAEKLMSTTTSTKMTNVKEKNVNLSIDPSYLKLIGAEVTSGFKNTTTASFTGNNVFSQLEKVTVDEDINLEIPPKTAYIIRYGVLKREVIIPVKMHAVLDGSYEEVEYVKRTGREHRRTHVGVLRGVGDEVARTVVGEAEILVEGVKEDMELTIWEKKLSDDDCANDILISKNEDAFIELDLDINSYDLPDWTKKTLRPDRFFGCSANASLKRFDSTDTSAEVFLDVSVGENCALHSGTVSFKNLVRDEVGLGYRDEYTGWSNEQDNSLILEWEKTNYLVDGEYLIDVDDIEVESCICND